jgi:pimeloyl-ACP methyl ester carboxylesterase
MKSVSSLDASRRALASWPARIAVVIGAAVAALVALTRVAGLLAPPHLAPAPGTRFRDRPEGRIAYEEAGAGPLVVLVPGMGDLRSEYRFLVPRLVEAGYRAVSLDLRGHGESDTSFADYSTSAHGSDVVALVRALGGGPALVVGTSMGAGAAVWAAAQAPDLIRGIVLVGPFVRETEQPGPLPKPLAGAFFQALLARPWGPLAWVGYYASLYPTVKPADLAEHLDRLRSNLTERGRMEALQKMMAYSKADVEARLGEVRAPTLVVMGTKDPDFPDPKAEARAVAGLLGGRVELIEGAGHYPHAEMPEVTAASILGFFASVRATV